MGRFADVGARRAQRQLIAISDFEAVVPISPT